MVKTKIVTVKSLTPRQEMATLRKLAKTHGRDSKEYQDQLSKMVAQMEAAIKKA